MDCAKNVRWNIPLRNLAWERFIAGMSSDLEKSALGQDMPVDQTVTSVQSDGSILLADQLLQVLILICQK